MNMDSANQDTVRSIAELIKPDDDHSEDDLDGNPSSFSINVEKELTRVGFPQLNRLDSQAPESLVAKSNKRGVQVAKPKIEWTRGLIIEVIMVIIFGTTIIAATAIIYHFYNVINYRIEMGRRIFFQEDTRMISVNNIHKDTVLRGKLGLDIPAFHLPHDCSDKEKKGVELCLLWKEEAALNITYYEEKGKSCYDIEWESLAEGIYPHDCYHLSGGHWYGGGIRKNQMWPIEKMEYEKMPFALGGVHQDEKFGPIIERYWLSSLGVAVFVENYSPLHISLNQSADEEQLCFYGHYDKGYFPNKDNLLPRLNYSICVGENVQDIHSFVVNKIGKPSVKFPPEKYFGKPVWSTEAKLGKELNQNSVLNFANEIGTDYSHSMLVIDQGWQSKDGDLEFDNTSFPDPEAMINELKAKEFDISVQIHPFVNTDAKVFQDCIRNDYFVLDAGARSPGLSRWYHGPEADNWYQGIAGSIDTSPAAVTWWSNRLKQFSSQYNTMHFSMSHSDSDYLPFQPNFHVDYNNTGQYCEAVNSMVKDISDSNQVQTVYRSQKYPVIVRMNDLNSTWESLQSVIPSVLHTGIIGYPYIMPSAAGGNHANTGIALPTKELYVRWLQLNTFLPIMHLSIHPNQFDSNAEEIAKTLLKLRENFLTDAIVKSVRVASQSMAPVVRPLWWKDPQDTETYVIDDEFMLGDSILVAPMVIPGTKRDVYLPKGTWTEQNTQMKYQGPLWIKDVQVSLETVLYYFEQMN